MLYRYRQRRGEHKCSCRRLACGCISIAYEVLTRRALRHDLRPKARCLRCDHFAWLGTIVSWEVRRNTSRRLSLPPSPVRSSKFGRERNLLRLLRRLRLIPLPRVLWRRSARGRPHERHRRMPRSLGRQLRPADPVLGAVLGRRTCSSSVLTGRNNVPILFSCQSKALGENEDVKCDPRTIANDPNSCEQRVMGRGGNR
jgi:hypothetical protein